ncbi:MAG: GatB/YqeY domain-containing protein [Bacteroidales bacterium]|nr:GatB/YqeY domain-containing protein [Bacteroidales bacterium]
MNLFDTVSEDIKKAMLAKEKDKLEALRAVKSAFLLARTEPGVNGELTSEAELKIIRKLIKQRKESAEIYQQQGRPELAEKEITEAAVIEQYLPAQMSEEELIRVLKAIIEKAGATLPAHVGKVMGIATKELAGKAEGKTIMAHVRQLLGG